MRPFVDGLRRRRPCYGTLGDASLARRRRYVDPRMFQVGQGVVLPVLQVISGDPLMRADRMRVRIGNVVIGMNETSNIGSP